MSTQQSRTYLITGCTRGIGRAMADIILARPNAQLIGLVRSPSNDDSQGLRTLARKHGNKIILLQYDAVENASAASAIAQLRKDHPDVDRIDVAIANAGAVTYMGPTLDATPEDYLQHYQINTLGPLSLFKAILPLLQPTQPAGQKAKFIAISSGAGSTGRMVFRGKGGAEPYGMSKAALNHCVAKLRWEHPEVAFGILNPGATKTDFGGGQVDWDSMPNAKSVEEVVPQLMDRIDEIVDNPHDANVEFKDWKGDVVPW